MNMNIKCNKRLPTKYDIEFYCILLKHIFFFKEPLLGIKYLAKNKIMTHYLVVRKMKTVMYMCSSVK